MLDDKSKELRRLCLRALKAARKGHIGSTFSIIEILRSIYETANSNPADPNRDRIILSKGHGALALYSMLVDKGYVAAGELDKFCQPDGILGGHPSHHVNGVECDTGALGHGLPIGIGMAISAKIQKRNCRIFVIVGDGECQEGSVWEAALAASKHKLDNLTLIVDYNKIQSAGFVHDICPLEPLKQKFVTFGFNCWDCDGHDMDNIRQTLKNNFFAKREHKPMCIIAHTVKGKGCSFAENNPSVHYYSNLDDEMIAKLEAELA